MKSPYKCPDTAFKKQCSALNDECPKWVRILGKNPQTDEPVDQWDCADRWMPILMIEASKETRQAAAAIESFRNEVARTQPVLLSVDNREVTDEAGVMRLAGNR